MERTSSFALDWIALLYLRNIAILTTFYGTLHLRLHTAKGQGMRYKFTNKWLAKGDKRFLFGNQTWDNIFFSVVSGCTIWTAYEALTLWAFANNLIPFVGWQTRPVYCAVLLVIIPLMRDFHFYWIHRLLHRKSLMKIAHHVHHRNVNTGPWSGMSMHPIEHLVYLSGILLHWIIPSHPIHAMAHIFHAVMTPAPGHTGFNEFVIRSGSESKKERTLTVRGSYVHWLHHRHFTVNFGSEVVPLDKLFGSWHDGTPEAQERMLARRRRRAKA